MTDQDVLDKVRKLLSRTTDRGATDAEADTALRLANELLAKHNLTLLNVQGEDEFKKDVTHKHSDRVKGASWGGHWIGALALAVSRATYTDVLEYKDRVLFIGSSTDVEASLTLFTWLAEQCTKRVAQARKENGIGWCTPQEIPFTKNYLIGMAMGISQRLKQEGYSATGTALVRVTQERNHEYKVANFNFKQARPRRVDTTVTDLGYQGAYDIKLRPTTKAIEEA